MWKLLYQLASPKLAYRYAQLAAPWCLCIATGLLLIGMIWGLAFTPADAQQGEAFRIIYVHVPCAFLSLAIYAFMGFLAVLRLVWKIKLAGILLLLCAEVGALMTLLALLTGSIWGKPMWGAWWVWDARLTSELILFLLYAALLMTAQAYTQHQQADALLALLTLVGLVDLPIIHYSVFWWNTLHQGPTFTVLSKPHIHASMLTPMLFMLSGLSVYVLGIVLTRLQSVLLWRERRAQWVSALIQESNAC
jgi:heme exporter protein C